MLTFTGIMLPMFTMLGQRVSVLANKHRQKVQQRLMGVLLAHRYVVLRQRTLM